MHSLSRKAVLFSLVLVVLLAGCGTSPTPENPGHSAAGKLQVTVSIVPQQYFVERIGGQFVEVNVMVLPGNSPATYEPKPEQLTVLSKSAAYFGIGVAFENAWLAKIAATNPEMLMVDTAQGIERQPIADHHHEEEEEEEAHVEGALDPHIWVSPELVKVQAQNIYAALAQLDPEHEATYKANLESFIADIDILESDIQDTLSGLPSKKFMVFHPAWGYFADDFGLEQIPVEVGGQEPSAQELAQLIELARAENIKVIFAQPEFSTQDAQTIATEIGGEVLLISPLAPDWLSNMRQVASTFAKVLQ